MNIADVYSELAAQLDTIPGLRVYAYPPDQVQVPAAAFAFPDNPAFDLTYQRGGDRLTVPLHVLVSGAVDRLAVEELGRFTAGSGGSSVKQVLEAGVYTAFDFVRVASARFESFLVARVDYVGATFLLDVVGTGD